MLMQSNMRNLIHYPQTNDALLAQTSLVLSLTKLNKLKENKLIDADWIIKACLSLKRLREDFTHWLSRGFCQVTLLPFSLRNATLRAMSTSIKESTCLLRKLECD